ncbi:hypothetical protein M422DRAFT_140063, partial [Sphaerobolus stellatus SS14]
PFNPQRIQEILDKINIGTDLTSEQSERIITLIRRYPDIFALNLSEVFPVDFIEHKLNVDPETVLPKKIYQKPVTPAQKEWYQGMLDDMERAGIIQAVPAEFIK